MITLTSKRLELRPFKESDISEMYEIIQDDEIKVFLPGVYTSSKEQLKNNLEVYVNANFKDDIYLAITDIKTDMLLGAILLVRTYKNNMEISYFIRKENRKSGLMLEVLQIFLKWYAESEIANTIVFVISKNNESSLKLLERLKECKFPILNMAMDDKSLYYCIRPWCMKA